MKRILALLIVLGMLFGVSSFAEAEAVGAEFNSAAASHMYNLGLLNGMTDYEFSAYPVTRGELANVIKNLMKLNFGRQTVFSDVDVSTEYYEGIMICAEYGYMKGYGDGTFRPENPVTYNEAYKVFVTLLEYDGIVEYRGGYPLGYYQIAKEAGIVKAADGASNTGYVTREALPELIFELLLARCNEMVSIQDETASFSPSNVTFAKKHLRLDYVKGIISADEIGSIETENTSVNDDRIRINGMSLSYIHSYSDRLLGKYADAFYDSENGNKAVSVAFPENYNQELWLSGERVVYKSDSRIEYSDGTNTKSLSVFSDVLYILNGEPVLYYDLSSITDEQLIFINNDADSRYDILRIEKTDFYAVSYIYGDDMVYDVSGKSVSLASGGSKEIIIEDIEGNPLSLSDIVKDMSLNVTETTDKRIVIADTNFVSGKVTEIISDLWNEISVDSSVYTVNPKLDISSLNIDEYKKFWLDIYGRIFCFSKGESGNENYAYIINGGYNDSFEFSFKLKLLKDSGEISVYDAAQILYINGMQKEIYSKDDLPAELYSNSEFKRQLIRYTLNDKGEIFKITLPGTAASGSDFFFAASAEESYVLNSGSIGGTIILDDNTKIFVAPKDEANREDENYFVFKRSNLNTYQEYTAEAYQTSDKYTADIVVLKGDYRGISYETNLAVFVREAQGVDSEGNYRSKLYYFDGNDEQAVFIDYSQYPQAKNLSKGDVFRMSLINGEVSGFEYVYDFDLENSQWKLSRNPTSDSFESSNRMAMGYIAGYDGEILRLSYNADFSAVSPYTMEGYKTAAFAKTVVESDGSRILIRKGTDSDIRLYDRAVIMQRSGSSRCLIIYKIK